METIKVNMTPCEDVQTIHASQNDNEAREWGFELHNNGEKIDSSSISDQLVFKAYKGGTEQILPENGSIPTTSPIIADIKYPQGELTDQKFLYRESPTEEDGLAKITDIKGNTLNWNQLMENGNFADTSKWSAESGATLSISNNIATISSTTANNGIRQYFSNPLTVNHKYLIKAEFNVPTEYRCVIGTAANQGVQIEKLVSTANTWTEVIGIGTCTIATTTFYCFVRGTTYENVKIRNVMCFDLTQMGLDISSPSDFTSLFPLPYYAYNQGTLLSFMGNGIKTTNKNFVTNFSADSSTSNISFTQADGVIHATGLSNGTTRTPTFTDAIPMKKGTYVLSGSTGGSTSSYALQVQSDITGTWANVVYCYDGDVPFTLEQDCNIRIRGRFSNVQTTNYDVTFYPMVRFADTDSTFEPYTESTLSLPISTYFSNGMKSAGSVYDELTETKAITRIGSVDLGSLTWNKTSGTTSEYDFFETQYPIPTLGGTLNVLCPLYKTVNVMTSSSGENKAVRITGTSSIRIRDLSYTDATAFKQAMSGVYLYYELATPIETEITTASLVTENSEIPLSNEDGILVGKCTEQLSSESGFFDAKIKLADEDGECYSNKLQLHVERSQQ